MVQGAGLQPLLVPYDGQLQTLDHILITNDLYAAVSGVRFVHFDNDYYERDETRRATGVSDHDPPVVTFALPRHTTTGVAEGSRPTAHRGEAAPGRRDRTRSSSARERGLTPDCPDPRGAGQARLRTVQHAVAPGRPARARRDPFPR